MEQPNMMPNGMGGGGNMNMPNMGSMQRPQSGNFMQQIHALVVNHLRNTLPQLPQGWQQTMDLRERAQRMMQMITALRQIENDTEKCINITQNWEQRNITNAPSREDYLAGWDRKLNEIAQKRRVQFAQNGLGGLPQNNMGNMHNMNMQNGTNGMMGMNPNFNNGMGMNMPNGGGMGMPNQMNMSGQQGFPAHLQRQMQPSPMPQPTPNGSIDPSALTQNPNQLPDHMLGQMGQPTPQPRQQQPNMNPGQGGVAAGPSENDIRALAKRYFDAMPDENKNKLRQQAVNNMNEQQKQQLQSRGIDPLNRLLMQRARDSIIKNRQQQMAGQQNGAMGAMGGNVPQTPSQPGQPNFDISSIMGQRANAIKSQESGGEVVPASNNNNDNAMQQNGQQMANNFNQNPQMMNNPQLTAMQKEKHRREKMARQNQLARDQAIAQQNQLRGQPGGLNAPNALNGGQVNSPAMNMNMLNRPTFPGQATPSTPHQNQGMPQTPSTGANQLVQHHQNMLNQNGQNGQLDNLAPHQRQWLNSLAPEQRAKLESLGAQQVNELLAKFTKQQQGAMMPPGGGQPNGMNMNMMGGQAMANQAAMNGAAMGSAVPGFNSQPPQNQGMPGSMDQSAGVQQQKVHQHQQQQLKQRAMDLQPFPKKVLQALTIAVPDYINTWGQLKQHIMQNQGVLPQDLMQRLSTTQAQYFNNNPNELRVAFEQLKQMVFAQNNARGQPPQGQQQAGPPGMFMPNGQAPQAQMVAPPAQMQQPPPNQGVNNANNFNITQESINLFREKIPQAKGMTDDQVRDVMKRRRVNQVAQANQDMQQNLRNAQFNATQLQKPQQIQTPQPSAQRAAQNQQQGQGQKRGNSDDVVEIPNPNAPTQQPLQTQPNQQRGGPPAMPNVPGVKSREELLAMPVEQRNAYIRKMQEIQALRRAQGSMGANPQQIQTPPVPPVQQQPPQQMSQQGRMSMPTAMKEEMMKIKAIWTEVNNSNPKGPQVQLDQKSMQEAQQLLKKLWPIALTMEKTLVPGYRAFGDERIKEVIKIKLIITQNAADASGRIKDYLGVSLETLKRSEAFFSQYLRELKARQQAGTLQDVNPAPQEQVKATPQQQDQKQPEQAGKGKQPTPAAPQKAQAQPPLNRKNSSQHARKASHNKAPPAPTENKTFDWASPTPHGVPKYDPGRTELTADKLKFPPQKKRKTTDSQASTPAAQTGTPAAAQSPVIASGSKKRESPEQTRKMPEQPERARFSCEDPFCQAGAHGFESEEALRKHREEEHAPVEDPFKFLMETVDTGLTGMGMDLEGKPLPVKMTGQAVRRAPAAQKVAERKAAATGTPGLKAESATPATPASAGGKGKTNAVTPAGKKTAEVKAPKKNNWQDQTLYESLVEQLGIENVPLPPSEEARKRAKAPPTPPQEEDSWLSHLTDALAAHDNTADNEVDMDDWTALPLEEDLSAWRGDLNPDTDTEASSSSADLTPASSGTTNSDISELQRLKMVFEWDPSGNGDTLVPEKLRELDLSGDGQGDDQWNWSGDLVGSGFDGFFGAGSGLDGDDGGWKEMFGTERGF